MSRLRLFASIKYVMGFILLILPLLSSAQGPGPQEAELWDGKWELPPKNVVNPMADMMASADFAAGVASGIAHGIKNAITDPKNLAYNVAFVVALTMAPEVALPWIGRALLIHFMYSSTQELYQVYQSAPTGERSRAIAFAAGMIKI